MPNVMLCQTQKYAKSLIYPAIAQEKCDGLRVIIEYFDDMPILYTRTGNELTQLYTLEEEIASCLFKGYAYDGELLFGDLPRKESNGLGRKAQRDGYISIEEEMLAHVKLWDVINKDDYLRGFDYTTYDDRFRKLRDLVNLSESTRVALVPTRVVKSEGSAQEFYEEIVNAGGEGIIVKNVKSHWRTGRSMEQIKFKAECDADLRIHDFIPGEGKYTGLIGSLCCKSDCGSVIVNVGSGLTDFWRHEIATNWEKYLGKIVRVHYNSIITAKNKTGCSLFLPRFKENFLRADKWVTSTLEELLIK